MSQCIKVEKAEGKSWKLNVRRRSWRTEEVVKQFVSVSGLNQEEEQEEEVSKHNNFYLAHSQLETHSRYPRKSC